MHSTLAPVFLAPPPKTSKRRGTPLRLAEHVTDKRSARSASEAFVAGAPPSAKSTCSARKAPHQGLNTKVPSDREAGYDPASPFSTRKAFTN
jgi:hypothetical protein